MLSNKLVASIEDHSERLMDVVTERVRRDPDLATISRIAGLGITARPVTNVLRHLGAWLAGENRDAIASQYEEIGGRRYAEQIPLHECVKACIF